MKKINQSPPLTENTPETRHYTFSMDHFNAKNSDTISIKYYYDEYYYDKNPNSPICVMLGGEGPESKLTLQGHFVINDVAEKHHGLMLSLEHRFYGESYPTDLRDEYLKFLSAEQALADYAEIIVAVKEELKENYGIEDPPVIVFGGSYSGNLAAWFRQKYPNVVDIAYASSAPVYAEVEFVGYYEVVTWALGEDCANTALDYVFRRYDKMTKQELIDIFNPCTDLSADDRDISVFFDYINGAFAGNTQYNSSEPISVNTYCNRIMLDVVQMYPEFVSEMYKDEECIPSSYSKEIEELKDITGGTDISAGRAWIWQTCTAYGYYQYINDTTVAPFSTHVTLDLYLDYCKDAFELIKK